MFNSLINRKNGNVSGSGKTTTLYAALEQVRSPEVNIITIEDPVEYKILGVNQIQVNLKTNLTFANGLGSILRQDPDVIFVALVVSVVADAARPDTAEDGIAIATFAADVILPVASTT